MLKERHSITNNLVFFCLCNKTLTIIKCSQICDIQIFNYAYSAVASGIVDSIPRRKHLTFNDLLFTFKAPKFISEITLLQTLIAVKLFHSDNVKYGCNIWLCHKNKNYCTSYLVILDKNLVENYGIMITGPTRNTIRMKYYLFE